MNHKPAIVISAFDRPASLLRLLNSISKAVYNEETIDLIISIDNCSAGHVADMAESFTWDHGTKRIIKHPAHLGLKQHILSCGDLTGEYGSLILLEDDLAVSPHFYSYACKAADYYENEEKIAGISLYTCQVAENCFHPFRAIDDGSDVYFMQVASSYGQLWTKKHWQKFRTWFADHAEIPKDASVPAYLHQWGPHSWKKHFIHYLIASDTYFVFPRLSLTTTFEGNGTNSTSDMFGATLQFSYREPVFQHFTASASVYDAWFEISPGSLNKLTGQFKAYPYEVDLYGTKPIIENHTPYILTSKTGQNPVFSFSSELFPLESNAILDLTGNTIGFYKKEGNELKEGKTRLPNYLDSSGKVVTLSVIIPITDHEPALLKNTLDSILKQPHPFFDLSFIIHKDQAARLAETLSVYNCKFSVVETDEVQSIDREIARCLKKCNGDIVTIVKQGRIFSVNAFDDVNSIFKSYASVNWIKGIDETCKDPAGYETLNVINHRIIPSEVRAGLKSGVVDFSLEGHFFRRYCISAVNDEFFFLDSAVLCLLEKFQLNIVVKPFIINYLREPINSDAIKKYNTNKAFIKKNKLKDRLFSLLFRLLLSKHNSTNWLYTVHYNFPDVLRYDTDHKTFYFNKS